MEERLLNEVIPLVRLRFSPLALQLDRAANDYENTSFVACFLRAGARLVSLLMPHAFTTIAVSTEDTKCEEEKHQCDLECMTDHAIGSLDRILEGYGVIYRARYQTPLLILLLWRVQAYQSFLEVYSTLKRVAPECRISVEEAMTLPQTYAKFREWSYVPSSSLMMIEYSALKISNDKSR